MPRAGGPEAQQARFLLTIQIMVLFSCVSSILDQSSSPQARGLGWPKLPSPSCPGTIDGDWLLGLTEATALDSAQAVSDDVCRDSARRRWRRRHFDTNAVAVTAPAAAAAAAGQRQPDRADSAASARPSK
jgi:hypothetical protein